MEDKVMVGEQEIVIGKPTPAQVAGIVKIVAELNIGARQTLAAIEKPSEMDYVMALLANLDEKSLINLAALSIGSDKKFATENFDIGWVIPALTILIRKSNIVSVITNFTSMLSQDQ